MLIMETPQLTTVLRFAADALEQLYEARFRAIVPTGPHGHRAEEEEELFEARQRLPACRTLAAGLLKLGHALLLREPGLPLVGPRGEEAPWELPSCPAREERGVGSTGLHDLAELVESGAESRLDDHRYAEGLRRWCREYEDILEEVGIPNAPRVTPREFDDALVQAGVERTALEKASGA